MIIRKLKLNPFAGTGNREFVFSDSLNVVLGPNESGKSTFVNALLSALFTPTDQTDAKLKKFYSSYLPKSGGDTINVELSFCFNDMEFSLSKSWGATRVSKLTAGASQVYTSPAQISGLMQEMLGLNQGTYENVLVIRQALLSDTIDAIRNEAGASESIQKILRNSRFNMDGVSVSRLKKLTEEKVNDYFDHWDAQAGRPQGGRDIDNEWKVKVGKILSAYYTYRRAEAKYNSAVKFEKDLDELITRIDELSGEAACLQNFVGKYQQAFNDIGSRRVLELQQDKLEKEIAALIDVQRNWPKLEAEIEFLSRSIKDMGERIEILNQEKRKSEQFEAQKNTRKIYEKAKPLYDQFLSEKEKLGAFPKITPADIQAMNKAVKNFNESRIRFEAQKLRIKIHAKQAAAFQLKEGFGDSVRIDLKENEEIDKVLSGSIGLDTEQFKLSVISGDGDSAKILADYRNAQKVYSDLLSHYSVHNESELAAKAEKYNAQAKAAESISTQLGAILEGRNFQELERQYEVLEDIPVQRPFADIVQEHASLSQRLYSAKSEKEQKSGIIESWVKEFTNSDNVFDIHADKKNELKKVKDELASLRPFPPEFTDPEKFVDSFRQQETELKAKSEELTAARIRRAEIEKLQPDAAAEEYEKELAEAEERFEKIKKESISYLLIRKELDALLEELDGETFEPLKMEVSRLIAGLTLNKYTSLSMNEILPSGIGSNGTGLPVDLLSAGTKDILALALRLGMASFYLNGRRGFIVMDDPLVNLDPARQKAAVECIKNTAERTQVILLTCHPSHAELFKSSTISL